MSTMTCAECGGPVLENAGHYATFERVYHPDCYERIRARQHAGLIVVVNRSVASRELVAAALRRNGHAVREARSPEEALRVLAESRAKIVIIDLRLPGAGAVELIRRVRSELSTRDVPIIAVAPARVEAEQIQAVLDAGASMCCVEPVATANFNRVVTIMLHANASRGLDPLPREGRPND
jgi:CheY-like chemotaxis protein